jgi:hypothetical protein
LELVSSKFKSGARLNGFYCAPAIEGFFHDLNDDDEILYFEDLE